MQQYSTWAPKEFDEAALEGGGNGAGAQQGAVASGQQPQQQEAGAQQQQQQQQQAEQPGQLRPPPDPSGFVYDPNTGACSASAGEHHKARSMTTQCNKVHSCICWIT